MDAKRTPERQYFVNKEQQQIGQASRQATYIGTNGEDDVDFVVGMKRQQPQRASKDRAKDLMATEAARKRMKCNIDEAVRYGAVPEKEIADEEYEDTEGTDSQAEEDPIEKFWAAKAAQQYKAPQVVYKEKKGEELLRRILGYFPNVSTCAHAVVWKQDPHRREAKSIALQLDSLIVDMGVLQLRDSFVGEMMLRRFEALRIGNKTGDWSLLEVANETADFP